MYLLASKEDVHPNNAAMQERKTVKAEVKYQPTAHVKCAPAQTNPSKKTRPRSQVKELIICDPTEN